MNENVGWIVILIVIAFVTGAIGQGNNDIAYFSAIVFVIDSIILYFVPSIVAHMRDRPNKTSIVMLNLFLGWTFVGWVVAVVWAYSSTENISKPSAGLPQPQAKPTKKCPYCAEDILIAAIKCRHCGSDVGGDAGAVTPA